MRENDPVTKLFDLMVGHDAPNSGRNCNRCGMHYVFIGGSYKPPYDRYCGSNCAEAAEEV